MTHANFQIDISQKNLGKKFPPGGSQPPNFQKGFYVGYWTLLVQIFSLTRRKLWPVAFRKILLTDKQTEKQTLRPSFRE